MSFTFVIAPCDKQRTVPIRFNTRYTSWLCRLYSTISELRLGGNYWRGLLRVPAC
jgi:hypothetical protein